MWSKLSRWATPAALLLGVSVDGVAIAAALADGIAVIGETRLHWPFFVMLSAPFIGGALPGACRWWMWERPAVQRRRKLWADLNDCYKRLRATVMPETLNPDAPGNAHAIREEAVMSTKMVRERLRALEYSPPESRDDIEGYLTDWYNFVVEVMGGLKGTKREYDGWAST